MRLLRTALALGLLAGLFSGNSRAFAQSAADLAAGRELFVEALRDEEQGRFAEALGKYKRVQAVRDTPNIRFRMGTALERLGKITQAVEAYTAAVRQGKEAGGSDSEVVTAAQARLDALGPKVGHVALRIPSPPPANTEVTVDGEPVTPSAYGDVILDPGTHVVAATASGARPFRAQINVSEGAHVDVLVILPPDETKTAAPTAPSPFKTIGVVTGIAGAVLVGGGVVVLVLRSSDISKLTESCPGGTCPADRESELQRAHDRASFEGPLGVALLATGAAAIGAGVIMFVVGSNSSTAARLAPATSSHGAMLTFGRDF